ncbi:MAG: hypothetical protein GY697_21635 [Desulfobacterales bacterium]|nr:hypothetical protein [Desulfobacterales bacterium]
MKFKTMKQLEPISKNGFWFPAKERGIFDKIKAAANIKPEVPAKPMPCVVNTPVFRGFDMSVQRRVWAKRLF